MPCLFKENSKEIKCCLVCGESYYSRKKDSKFCSKKCFYIGRNKRERIWIKVKCKYCKEIFNAIPSEIKKGRAIFCSRKCLLLWRKQQRTVVCKKCGKPFLRNNKSQKYCSRGCFNRAVKDKEIFEYKAWIDRDGYKVKDGNYIHKIQAERALGRKLNSNEITHHVNGIKGDNRNKNLLICDRKFHAWFHQKMGQLYMKEHFK